MPTKAMSRLAFGCCNVHGRICSHLNYASASCISDSASLRDNIQSPGFVGSSSCRNSRDGSYEGKAKLAQVKKASLTHDKHFCDGKMGSFKKISRWNDKPMIFQQGCQATEGSGSSPLGRVIYIYNFLGEGLEPG